MIFSYIYKTIYDVVIVRFAMLVISIDISSNCSVKNCIFDRNVNAAKLELLPRLSCLNSCGDKNYMTIMSVM